MREFRDSSHHFRKSYLLLIIHECLLLFVLDSVDDKWQQSNGSAKKVNGLEQWQDVENSVVGHLW